MNVSATSRAMTLTQETGQAENVTPVTARRVLVVDDSPSQRHVLASSLRRWGFDVQVAATGDEAMRICAETPPDLVLSDWVMPGMNGLEFCQRFRRLPDDHYGYFILLTSKSEKNDIAQGLEAGADDFLTKPVDLHELRARIAAGERILQMQRELTDKNRLITDTLDELQRLYDSLDNDLIEAKKLQQSLIRDRVRSFATGDVSLMLRSSGHVGGDLVGFFPAGPHKLGLYAIDVSGHGISSALMTARLAGYLSATAPEQNVALERQPDGSYACRPPDEVIASLNTLVLGEMETEHYFTMLLADVDLRSGRVRMAQAGHPHPVIQRADGRIEQDGPGGFPVGLVDGVTFAPFETCLYPGDRLLMLSDGVTECPGANGVMLGETGLSTMLRDLATTHGPAFFETFLWKLGEFADGKPFPDDVSGILFEFRGTDQPK